MSRSRQSFWMIVGLGWLGFAPVATCAQVTEFPRPPGVRIDRGVDEVRKASVDWERRSGPERQVIDQVVLVPDLPTFLEAIAAWDERHYFPILIDDIELTFKFLRAFRPARVVALPAAPRRWRRRSSGTRPSPLSAGRGPPPACRRPTSLRATQSPGGSGRPRREWSCRPRQPDARRRGRPGRGAIPTADPLGDPDAVHRHPLGRRGPRAGPQPRNFDRRPDPELWPDRRRLRLRDAGSSQRSPDLDGSGSISPPAYSKVRS